MTLIALVLCASLHGFPQLSTTEDSVEGAGNQDQIIHRPDSTRSTSEKSNHDLQRQEQEYIPGVPLAQTQSAFHQFGSSSLPSAAAVESLLLKYPGMKSAILTELLVPAGPPPFLTSMSHKVNLLHQIDSLARMTPFKEMGLNAKRHLEYYDNPIDKRMRLHQAEIFGIIRWFDELLK